VAKLFLPQTLLEEWALEDKADVKDGKLTIAGEKASEKSPGDASFPVSGAVHFKKLLSGTDDKKLLSKVKSSDALNQLGAEHLADSVILGDTAYEVVPGYITDVPVPAPAGKGADKKASPEADLLAAFLLNKL
jgi:hypothetical protein